MEDLFKAPLFNLHDLVVISTAIATAVMLVMQALTPTKNTTARHYLTIFFICLLLHAIATLLMWNTHIELSSQAASLSVLVVITLSSLLKGPALFLYVCALTQTHFKHKKQHLLHLGAPFFIIGLILGLGISLDQAKGLEPSHNQKLLHYAWLLMKGIPALYALACIPVAISASTIMQSYYSNDHALGKNWLSMLCVGYAGYWSWEFFSQLFGYALVTVWQLIHSIDHLGIANNYLAFILLLVLFSYNISVTQQQLARAVNATKKATLPASEPTNALPAKTTHAHKALNDLAQSIQNLMLQQKPYLQSNITAEQFAHLLGRSAREVSVVLNQHFEQNFFEFINTHRVNEAKALLASPKHATTPISDILTMAGFNSQSAFQRFFKRITHMSPSEYRQQYRPTKTPSL